MIGGRQQTDLAQDPDELWRESTLYGDFIMGAWPLMSISNTSILGSVDCSWLCHIETIYMRRSSVVQLKLNKRVGWADLLT